MVWSQRVSHIQVPRVSIANKSSVRCQNATRDLGSYKEGSDVSLNRSLPTMIEQLLSALVDIRILFALAVFSLWMNRRSRRVLLPPGPKQKPLLGNTLDIPQYLVRWVGTVSKIEDLLQGRYPRPRIRDLQGCEVH